MYPHFQTFKFQLIGQIVVKDVVFIMFYAPLWFEEVRAIAIRKPRVKWNVPFHPTVSACKLALPLWTNNIEKWLENWWPRYKHYVWNTSLAAFLLSLQSRLYLGYGIPDSVVGVFFFSFFYKRPNSCNYLGRVISLVFIWVKAMLS